MSKKIKIAFILVLCLIVGVVAFQHITDTGKNESVQVAGLRSLIGKEVVTVPLWEGREEKIYLNERVVIDFHRFDVVKENKIVAIIDFADEFLVERKDKKSSIQEPFFRQIINLEYEMISETQLQVKNFTVECVSGTENGQIENQQIILPEQQVYSINEPIPWELFIDFTNWLYGIFDVMNLDCSVMVNADGDAVFSVSRDANDLANMQKYFDTQYN